MYFSLLAQYNDKCTQYDEMTSISAEYINAFNEANNRLNNLGGETVNEPVLDGESDYTSDSILEESEKQTVINNYINSQEFQIVISTAQANAVSDFKNSEEYSSTLEEHENIGRQLAYDMAREELFDSVYAVGVADGYSKYTQTEQFQGTVKQLQQKAYNQGVLEGYDKGKEDSTTVDLTELISVIIGLIGSCALSVIVTKLVSKKRRKKGK